MEEIIHAFGIDWRLIVIQMFNFALLMAALWYFLYTPILNILREREAKLKKGVEDAESAARALQDAGDEKARILKDARTEGDSIVLRAKEFGEEKGAAILTDAEKKAERMIADAKLRGEEEMTRIRKESEAEIAQAAILAAEAILKQK